MKWLTNAYVGNYITLRHWRTQQHIIGGTLVNIDTETNRIGRGLVIRLSDGEYFFWPETIPVRIIIHRRLPVQEDEEDISTPLPSYLETDSEMEVDQLGR